MEQLPDEAIVAARSVIFDHYGFQTSLSVIINNLSFNQIAHDCILGINKYFDKYNNEIAIYCLNKEPPIISPACAIYPINDLAIVQDTIVLATDIFGILAAIQNNKEVVYYAYDPMLFELISPDILQKIKDLNISYICRTEAHSKYLKNKLGDVNILGIVNNFDFEQIWKLINGKTES